MQFCNDIEIPQTCDDDYGVYTMIEVRADAICGISTLCLSLKPFFCSFHQILQASQAIHKRLNAYSRMPLIQIDEKTFA